MNSEQIQDLYVKEAQKYTGLAQKEERYLLLLSVLRLFSFIGGLILIYFGFKAGIIIGSLLIFGVLALFFYLLKIYSVHDNRKEFFQNHVKINLNESTAFKGDFSVFKDGTAYSDPGHDFMNDIDLFGQSSLFQYLNRTVTGYGQDKLAEWLSDPFILSAELASRREIVKELSERTLWRHDFMAFGMNKPLEKKHVESLLEWMKENDSFRSSGVKKVLIYLLPSASVISLVLLISGIINYQIFALIFLVNLLYITIGIRNTNKVHNVLSKKYDYLSSLNKLLKVFENEMFVSAGLNDIKSNITGRNISASVSVKKLSRLIQSFDSRMNMLIGVVLNGLVLWDYHCILRLEKWKSEYKGLFPGWLEMLGKVDAYISLANYAYNNPDFIYPVLSETDEVFVAQELGHPLIDEKKRVCNDFTLRKSGSICIISGANMAGKSTFLRTVAVNYILGMSGAPVCAAGMRFMPLKLFTSMRTTDSLSNNESYFYAELKRLKALKTRVEQKEPMLFILDEILKGTNSADKSLGSRLFLEKMVSLGATGMIATHDTSLGELESVNPGVVINKCFEIEIEGEKINFDYKLQDGITHKMNAAFLMKQMGILE